ncbi:MAG TPA: hypothetical protein PLZ43_13280 [bacterium]|nr:hypothetical protein [bacterium]
MSRKPYTSEKFFPVFISTKLVESKIIKDVYKIDLHSKIKCDSSIKYLYAVTVKVRDDLHLIVTSEKNSFPNPESGSHFVCLFDGKSHLNYGSSDNYADPIHFLDKAIEIIKQEVQELREENIVFKKSK